MNRRDFFRKTAIGGLGLPLVGFTGRGTEPGKEKPQLFTKSRVSFQSNNTIDLSPAVWIWYPSARTLSNTVVLLRKEIKLSSPVKRAKGWIVADSRYRLFVNGKRIQWGPPPSDPRWVEVDPLDLSNSLREGVNVFGVEVLFYGHGDGTWPVGKPGFLFNVGIEGNDGRSTSVLSDESWQVHLARSWKPGQYKRWYLRSLQEEFDARLYPYGWHAAGFKTDQSWLAPVSIGCPANKPSICANYPDYALDARHTGENAELRERSIPLMKETILPVHRLAESCWILWKRPPEEYFEVVAPDMFSVDRTPCATALPGDGWSVQLDGTGAAALTFEFEEQIVGWPMFEIEAPPGTIVELMVQESHAVGGPALLNTQFHSWARFICRKGLNEFETFDFESCRWMQLHVRGTAGEVKIRKVGIRRRVYPWLHQPEIRSSEPALQRLFDATVNTLNNCAQETLVDGMARERQQYSGDGGHQLLAISYAFGESKLLARYVSTFSQGATLEGYFLDCWPAYDRLARLMERQLQLTNWGPLLDHGVGFNFDCWYAYLYSGDRHVLKEPYPRLLRFADYLQSIVTRDGLLPAENLGVPSLYIDHNAFKRPKHKQCSFNLYAAAMFEHALAPLCETLGDRKGAQAARLFGGRLLRAAVRKFWDRSRGLFVDNLPWAEQEKEIRYSDRTLATSILYDQCPGNRIRPATEILAAVPSAMGFSYPANAGWRLWALAKAGRADVVVNDLRKRWATMESVRLNNTLQEFWDVEPDSTSQWSHCAVVPLYVLYMSLAGLRPLEPGFRRYEIVPQFADLSSLHFTAHTPQGPITIRTEGVMGKRTIEVETPTALDGEVVLPAGEEVSLKRLRGSRPLGRVAYRVPAGEKVVLHLKET
jgi:hypothetical protein